ncbi:unnamed protein product [Parascedosporium putredinis]|uniref:PRELI/MSF1 domain-containing protein n=1 Tax=Parascedosporium putredinis TaxID=1442378 RepID=A0A9P1M9J9_9PEZI|nr:unnamed protein product [Parascedosporium putredinis]CAI7995779.1 unnamed protein product [Parascedosporium putredinis]
MVLYHTATNTYAHPFPAVTLAYFLRYSSPTINPFAGHVLSTDTISSEVDSKTGRLHMTRIHLKKSRMPSAIFKLLPAGVTGGKSAEKASYILETSVVDIREGWMRTESRNLNFAGVLSVIEQQTYKIPDASRAPTKIGSESSTEDVREDRWLSGWMGRRIRGSIEKMASTKTVDQLGKSREGMRVVLETIRHSGVMGVLEMVRRERQTRMA